MAGLIRSPLAVGRALDVFLYPFLLASILPATALAQTAEVAVEQEVFRQAPNGRRLGVVNQGTRLAIGQQQGRWVEATIEGWIWTPSIVVTQRDGHDRIVNVPGGENLRDEPGGRISARLLRGFLLDRIEERGQWTRVRRTAWIWGPSLEFDPATAAGGTPGTGPAEPGERPAPVAATGAGVVAGPDGVRLRVAPEADTLATVSPGAALTVVERQGGWARVRLEGWVPAAELVGSDQDSLVVDVSAAALRANPDQYRGQRVRWEVQFISLERAEPVRTDFFEGEPFVLARAPDPSEGFVYLAVPPELLADVEELESLQSVNVLAQVRTGRSALMGVPVLDLLALY